MNELHTVTSLYPSFYIESSLSGKLFHDNKSSENVVERKPSRRTYEKLKRKYRMQSVCGPKIGSGFGSSSSTFQKSVPALIIFQSSFSARLGSTRLDSTRLDSTRLDSTRLGSGSGFRSRSPEPGARRTLILIIAYFHYH